MSEIRVDTIKAEDGIGAPSFPSGVSVSRGVITATSLQQSVSGEFTAGSLKVGNNIQLRECRYRNSNNMSSSGCKLNWYHSKSFTNTALFFNIHITPALNLTQVR